MSRLAQRRQAGCRSLPLVLVGCLVVGVALGLLISWWLWPVEYTDVSPDTLRPAHRFEYIMLIAQAYRYDGDLRRAQIRLAGLGDLAAVGLEVANLAEQQAAQDPNVSLTELERVRALAALAYALGHRRSTLAAYLPGGPGYVPGAVPTPTWTLWPTATSTVQQVAPTASPTALPTHTVLSTSTPTPTETALPSPTFTQTPLPTATPIPLFTRQATATLTTVPSSTATPTRTPSPTQTPRPTATPTRTPRPTLTPTVTPVPEPRFELVQQQRICPGAVNPGERGGQLRITVLNKEGEQQPNVELLIRWGDGEDRAFTGLKPEMGVGYADFAMEEGQNYQVGVIGMQSDVAQGIVADPCAGGGLGNGQLASWEVVFRLTGAPSSG